MSKTIRRTAALKALASALSASRTPGAPSVGTRLSAVPRMISQGLSGRYPHLDTSRLAMIVLGVLYVLSPVDLVPELLIPLLGLGDDAFVAAWVAGAVISEADAFLAWEADKPASHGDRHDAGTANGSDQVIRGEVIR